MNSIGNYNDYNQSHSRLSGDRDRGHGSFRTEITTNKNTASHYYIGNNAAHERLGPQKYSSR